MASTFTHDGVTLAYDDSGPQAGRALVLVHGFASNRNEGWRRTGWYDAPQRRGVRCVALDQRGHGQSEKLHDPAAYRRELLAGDLLALLDHLELSSADLFGYSMGSRTVLAAASRAPERVSNLILGGVGGRMINRADDDQARAGGDATSMADAMLAADPDSIADPMKRSFRQFAEEQGEDLRALAACSQAPSSGPPDPADLWALPMPVLVVAGQRDQLAGDPAELAQAFRHGHGVRVPGCDHFSAIPHALVKAAVFDFLDGVLEGEDDPFARRF